MKSVMLLRAMNDVQDGYIESAAPRGHLHDRKVFSPWFSVKTLVSAAAVLAIAVCITNLRLRREPSVTASPYQPCATLQEAEDITGYALSVPDSLLEEGKTEIMVYYGSMTELSVLDNEYHTVLYVRKDKGEQDISGIHDTYDAEDKVEIGGCTVTLRGDRDMYYVAVWTKNGFSYSLTSSKGLSKETMTEYIGSIE